MANQILTQKTKNYLILKIPFPLLEEISEKPTSFKMGSGFVIWQIFQSLPQFWKEKGTFFVKKIRKENEDRLKRFPF